MRQRELYPAAFDVEADALDALGELDVDRGLACVLRARTADPTLPNLDALEAALAWLGSALAGGRDAASIARAFLARPAAGLAPGAASFADRALARRGLELAGGAFLDDEARVPRGALLLVLDRRAAARRELETLAVEYPERGDIAGYFADAALLADEPERANAALVRALVADPARIDFARTCNPELAVLARELGVSPAPAEPADSISRARLFPEAWLRGVVRVPSREGGDAWLDGRVPRLAARIPPGADAPAARMRRFALLFYADRARPAGDVDIGAREEMAELEPDLFARVMARLREREALAKGSR